MLTSCKTKYFINPFSQTGSSLYICPHLIYFSNRTFSILCCFCKAVTSISCKSSLAGHMYPGVKLCCGGGSLRAQRRCCSLQHEKWKSTTHLSGWCMTIVWAGKVNSAGINEVPTVKHQTILKPPISLPSQKLTSQRGRRRVYPAAGQTGKC